MNVSTKAPPNAVFDLRSATLSVLALGLKTSDLTALAQSLQARYGATPGLFEHEPVVVDLSILGEAEPQAWPDFAALCSLLAGHGLKAVAVRSGSPAQMAAALAAGLAAADAPMPPVPAAAAPLAPEPAPETEPPPPAAVVAAPVEAQAPAGPEAAARAVALVIDRPLRSGQQVYARGGDLVVMAAVNAGADVLADGNIHVYAPLRGRAFAGAAGDTTARIFSTCMEPQLVSIAGVWKTVEVALPAHVASKPAQVRLDGSEIKFEPLKS